MSLRNAWRRFTGDDVIDQMWERDRQIGQAFRAVTEAAPEGHYFRTLERAVAGSVPYGQPVDMPRLVHELAKLEQRLEDLERR